MSVRVMAWVWDNGPADPTERLVLLALADFCDDGGACWPSMARVAEKASMTERGARKVVRRLEAGGWVKTAIGGGRGGSSRYTVAMKNPERETGNDKPGMTNPEHGAPKPGTRVHETRNGGSAEPSGTIIEPSLSVARRKTRIPPDAILSDRHREIAAAKGLTDAEAEAQFLRFRDWARAKGQAYLDWDAAWRNWITSPHFKPITGGGHAPKRADDKLSAFIAGARR
jgi:hypothetical protein